MENISEPQVKGYEIIERIGAGGFGAVYRAFQLGLEREVAIKVILPDIAQQPDFVRRFEAEAQLIAHLEHMNIVPLYDYWRDPQGTYLVMRCLRGGSLADHLKQGALGIEATAKIITQIASALAIAHQHDVIHRDIKPANILLDEEGNAYLTDFGIAKDNNRIDGSVTAADMIIGSLDYISPEQARSEVVTPRTDIYSLGVVLYEILAGEHPFPNLSSVERMYKHINDPLPHLGNLPLKVGDKVNQVIQQATAKKPTDRFEDVSAFADAFVEAAHLKRQPIPESLVELLTPREQEVLQLMINGLSNREITDKLVVTLSSVNSYQSHMYRKLRVKNRVQAIARGRELDLLYGDATLPRTLIDAGSTLIAALSEPENPYKGLQAFQLADSQDFFGRDKVTQKLISRLNEKGDWSRFLAIVGPSGSGKSSLVNAGLIPALYSGEVPGSDRWFIAEMLPGPRPLDELEVALMRVATKSLDSLQDQLQRDGHGLTRAANLILPDDGSELVLVIDQFEEVFTLSEDEALHEHMLELLYNAATAPRSRVHIIVTLRADFFDRPLRYPVFGEMLRNRMETVLPLSADELEQAIIRPAQRVGVTFEDGLVASIVGEANYQSGALPLLQYALTELFERCEKRTLTREAYQEIGGTVGALAKRADEIYLEYDAEGQAVTRQMFLRLVTLGEGVEDTRRRVVRSELMEITDNEDLIDDVIGTFASYRLLSLDYDPITRSPVVEVAHEAILREWERLRLWLNGSRDEIRLQRALADANAQWQEANHDPSFLLRGTHLEQYEIWADETQLALTQKERHYITSSIKAREQEQQVEQERQAHEAHLERRTQNLLRMLVGVFAVAAVIAMVLALQAFSQRQTAQNEANLRATAQAIAQENADEAIHQQQIAQENADEARSLALAAQAQMALNDGNIDEAIQQAEQSIAIDPNGRLANLVLVLARNSPRTTRIFQESEGFFPAALAPQETELKFAIVSHMPAEGFPFADAMVKGMEDACALLQVSCQWFGRLITVEEDQTIEEALNAALVPSWEEALAWNPDAIGTMAIDTTDAVKEQYEQAVEHNIPMIMVNAGRLQDPTPNQNALLYVGQDEFIGGESNARRVFEQAKADDKPIDRGVCFIPAGGADFFHARCAGVESVFVEEGIPLDIIIIGETGIPGEEPLWLENMSNYFANNPNTNAIFSLGADPTAVLKQYFQQARIEPGDIYATSHDASAEVFEMIREGYLLQTIDQQPYMQGFQAIISLYLYQQYGIRPSGFVNTASVVDRSNVDDVAQLVEMGYR